MSEQLEPDRFSEIEIDNADLRRQLTEAQDRIAILEQVLREAHEIAYRSPDDAVRIAALEAFTHSIAKDPSDDHASIRRKALAALAASPADPRREVMERVCAAVLKERRLLTELQKIWVSSPARRWERIADEEATKAQIERIAAVDALAALDKPAPGEPVMLGINTEVPDVAED